MSRIKKRNLIIQKPSTTEIFHSLSSMTSWSKILHAHGPEKEYKSFLKNLIDVNYFESRNESVTIKKVASTFALQTTKVTKWLYEIYEQILELNFDKPELFANNKAIAAFYCSNSASTATFHLGIDVIPREFENFTFSFVKAKVGTSNFWVKRVEYEVYEDFIRPTIWLQGWILNRYRELAIDEALFKGWLHFMDQWKSPSFEIDKILLSNLRK